MKKGNRAWIERWHADTVEVHWKEPFEYDDRCRYWLHCDGIGFGYRTRLSVSLYTLLTGLEPPTGNQLDELCDGKYVCTWIPA